MRGICSGQSARHGRAHRHRPALEPRSGDDVALKVARGMALVAHHDALDDVASVLDVSRRRARVAGVAGCWADSRTATSSTAQAPRETNCRETDIDSSSQHYVPEQAADDQCDAERAARPASLATRGHQRERVNGHFTKTHRPVKMRSGHTTGRTRLADDLPPCDDGARLDIDARQMSQQARTRRGHGR